MPQATETNQYNTVHHLKPDCTNCFGLCCVALYYSRQDGFPNDKSAGTPCKHLDEQFRCAVHERLSTMGLKGCRAYECFGAGQQVSQVTFKGQSWRQEPLSAALMFEVFLAMRQLHESGWYLTESLTFPAASPVKDELQSILSETGRLTNSSAQEILEFNLAAHHQKISALLRRISLLVRTEKSSSLKIKPAVPKNAEARKDFFGKDLRKKDFRCADLRGACLIAANLEGADLSGTDLIGADLRDANLKGANLSSCLFLTQFQVNAARGDSSTKLPPALTRPAHWG